MLKSELATHLIERMCEKFPQLTEKAISESTQEILQTITEALVDGGRMEIRGFGSFDVYYQPTRLARNPKTGEVIEMAPRYRVHFKPSKKLRLRLNASYR